MLPTRPSINLLIIIIVYQFSLLYSRWKGDLMWGIAVENSRVFSLPSEKTNNNKQKLVILMSQSEKQEVKKKFQASGTVQHASGAGHKLLCVNQGNADAYILSKNSTYMWDCCAPHAILLAQNGGVVSYKSLCDFKGDLSSCSELSLKHQITYHQGNQDGPSSQKWCNQDGIVAYCSLEALKSIIQAINND